MNLTATSTTENGQRKVLLCKGESCIEIEGDSALRDKKYTIKALSPSISMQDSPWHRSTFLRPFSVVDVAVRFILAATVISKQKYKIMPSLRLTTVQARLVSAIGGSDLTAEPS